MGSVRIVRKKGGEAKQNKSNQFVFTKEGVYFALSLEQMKELSVLMEGILNGSLVKVNSTLGEFVEED